MQVRKTSSRVCIAHARVSLSAFVSFSFSLPLTLPHSPAALLPSRRETQRTASRQPSSQAASITAVPPLGESEGGSRDVERTEVWRICARKTTRPGFLRQEVAARRTTVIMGEQARAFYHQRIDKRRKRGGENLENYWWEDEPSSEMLCVKWRNAFWWSRFRIKPSW